MRKNIIMFGNDNFEDISYNDGVISYRTNKVLVRLMNKNNVINYSNKDIDIVKTKRIIKLYIDHDIKIDGVYLAVSDLLNHSNLADSFYDELTNLILYLKEKNISCFIFDKLSKNSKSAIEYENIINSLQQKFIFKNVAHRTFELYEKKDFNDSNKLTSLCMKKS